MVTRALLRLLCLGLLWPAVASAQISSARIVDGVAAGQADVIGTDPAGTEQGLVVRPTASVTAPLFVRISDGSAAITPSAVDAAFNSRVTGPVAHDAAAATMDPLLMGCYASAAAPSDVSADVDAARAWCLRNGARVVNLAFGGTLVTQASLGIGIEDAAETAGGPLMMAGTVRRDAAVTSAGATGENATLNTDASGLLWTRQLDQCSGGAKVYQPISIGTATTTQLVAASAGNKLYVCAFVLQNDAADDVAMVEDATGSCASPDAGIFGGTTAATGFNLVAGGGLVLGSGTGTMAKTASTNVNVCLITSAATQLTGGLTYVLAP